MASNYAEQDVETLVINRLSQSTYDKLKLSGMVDDKQLYVIEDKTLNAHGKQVLSVADPVEEDHAATKRYADTKSVVEIDGVHSDLGLKHLSYDEFANLVSNGSIISN